MGSSSERTTAGGHWTLVWFALGVAVVVPPVVAAIHAVAGGWQPVGDQGVIGAQAVAVFSRHPPLVGMPSTVSGYTGVQTYHPGPLLFWALAIPVQLLGPASGLAWGAALLNVTSVGAAVACAWRAAGRLAAAWTATGVLAFEWALGPYFLRDPFNPRVACVAALGFLVALWAAWTGDRPSGVVAVLLGSLAAQSHITFAPLFGIAFFAAVAVLVVRWRRRSPIDPEPDEEPDPSGRRWTVATVVVFLVCWSGPILDVLFGRQNLIHLLTGGTGDGKSLGFSYGFQRLVDALAIPPTWWHRPPDIAAAVAPSTAGYVSALVVGAALVACVVWARSAGRTDVLRLLVVALGAAGAGVLVSAVLPSAGYAQISVTNRLLWWPISLVLWLALAIAASTWLVALAPRLARPPVAIALRVVLAVVVLAAVVTAVGGRVAVADDSGSQLFAAVARLPQIIERAHLPGPLLVTASDVNPKTAVADGFVLPGVVAHLAHDGHEVQVTRKDRRTLWPQYEPRSKPGSTLLIRYGPDAGKPRSGWQLLGVVPPDAPGYRGYDQPLFFEPAEPIAVYAKR